MLAALLAALAAAGLSGVAAWCGPVDPPRDRHAHRSATPTAGGLAVIAATALGLAMTAPPGEVGRDLGLLLGMAGVLGLFGAADDVLDLSAGLKLLAQLLLALAFAVFVARIDLLVLAPGLRLELAPIAAVGLTAAWLVVMVNAVNFMDGADGLAAGANVVTLLGLAAVSWATGGDPLIGTACLIAAAAGLGFLPWNFPRARLFQGDAGSQFSGFLIGGLAVLLFERDLTSPFFVPVATLPILVDVLLTLFDRARRRRPLFQAHREHLYQLWLDHTRRSHAALAWRFWGLSALAVVLALQIRRAPEDYSFGLMLASTGLAALFWANVRRPFLSAIAESGGRFRRKSRSESREPEPSDPLRTVHSKRESSRPDE